MSYDRVEMDGALNNMYFMLSHSSAYEMYKGYMKEIATLYDGEGVSDDTSYEESWFARISSSAYFSDGKVYYLYDATDQLAMMREYRNYQNSGSSSNMQSSDFEALIEGKNPTFRLVYHTISDTDIKEDGADSDFTTLIEFNHKEDSSGSYGYDTEEETTALVYNPKTNAMEENELLTTLFAQYKEECDIYPSIKITAALYGEKLFFNLSNCILSYELSTGKVEKVKEYNTVFGKRDKSNAFGGLAFSVVDNAEEADLQVINHPIAALTIKDDGKMYASVATNYAFISGKKTVDDSSSFGYEFEESNFNPDYSVYTRKETGETNDNDEFMWSAVFVDRIDMSASCAHTYEPVTVAPTCGRDGFTENRCTKCDAPQADSRVVDEGSAFDAHHYVHYDETYYTKDSDGNRNTGECYVCTVCGYAVEEPDEPESDATEEEIEAYEKEKEIWDNAVATAGHTYEPADAVWGDDCSSVTFSRLECSFICPDRKEYLDCLVEDTAVSVECKQTTAEAAAVCEGSCETGVVMIYTSEGVTEDGYKYKAVKEVKQEAGEHTYVSEFTWADNTAEDAEVPYTAIADVKCEVCGTVIAEDVNAVVIYDEENSKAATCTEAGSNFYTATVTVDGVNYTSSREEEIPATGNHNYENGTCTVCGEKENPFDDVSEDDYFYDAVLWAYKKGITLGTDETHFSPWNNCTRAQVVTFLWRTMGEPTPKTTENPFVDVAEDAHYYNAVLWAYENDITLGVDSTHFAPDNYVTRGQFVTFLYRNEGKLEPETTENPFVDVDENKYYYKAVLWAYENEITLGKDATHFVPENNCTRGQVVTFLYRAYGEEE